MKNFHGLEQIWTIKQIHNGEVIWIEEKKNIIPDEGEKALVDTFYRANSALYFASAYFYVGLYKGSINESTILATIPGEPSGNGYARTAVERSEIGWPTIEQHEGDWRVVSKTLTITASGGSIGPVDGAFLCTSLNNTGVLIGAVAMSVSRTIPAGDKIEFTVKAKQK
jgi:hypothetical protein